MVRSELKTALLHYWLTGMRGGEMVFDELCRMFPMADVYTHAALPAKLSSCITAHPLHESWIARLPLGRTHCQMYLPLMPFAQRSWDFSGYDLIVSSESGPVKGIRKPSGCRHICYCHTPMRYLWDMFDDYYADAGLLEKIAMRICKNYLRNYDLRSTECVDIFIANSCFVAERIKRIYDRNAIVIYPPVNIEYFGKAPALERKHYLFVGQLVCYKRPDSAVSAFSKLSDEVLLVVGDGPMLGRLERIASPNVRFLRHVTQEQLRTLYASAKALIFPGIEDFGIVPVEAMAAGCPVIALNHGGTAETVVPRKSGVFLKDQSPAAILEAIEQVRAWKWNRNLMYESTTCFSQRIFQRQMRQMLEKVVDQSSRNTGS